MKCQWWPEDRRTRCGRHAKFRMFAEDDYLGRLCEGHKAEAEKLWPTMIFKASEARDKAIK